MITQQRYRQMVLCGHGAAILTVNSDIASITTIPMETINLHRLKGPFDVDLRVWHWGKDAGHLPAVLIIRLF